MKRLALCLALLAGVLAIPPPASAQVPGYVVVKCHPWNYSLDEVAAAGGHPSYSRINDCSAKSSDHRFGVANTGAAGNSAYSQFMYIAPPGTFLDRACLQHRLRRQSHHRAEIVAFPGHQVLEAGGDTASGWSATECYELDHQQLIVRLACNQAGGCPTGTNAHAYVRNLEMRLGDPNLPGVTGVGGTLWDGGRWLSGSHSLHAGGADSGAGIAVLGGAVNGAVVGRQPGGCTAGLAWPYSGRLVPCQVAGHPLSLALDTRQSPFVNGTNHIGVYAEDYAGSRDWRTLHIKVDNASPTAAFANSQDPEDPEAIRAHVGDKHSGVRTAQIYYRGVGASSWLPLDTRIEGGEARTRVDSSALPAGEYEFKADVEDAAGNAAHTTLRQNGTPMRLSFPLRLTPQIEGGLGPGGSVEQTVRYGTASSVKGHLVGPDGRPLGGKELTVMELFGDGALIRERPTSVVTDAEGRFETRIPAGPSREVEVRFAGSPKYVASTETLGELNVRGRASFRTSSKQVKEGERVAFMGHVRHHGARIPAGGKLIELQVRVRKGSWETIREAFRTRPNGRFKLAYRFGRHYTADAMFRFRVKVQSEGDWPYEGASTKQRRIIVRAG